MVLFSHETTMVIELVAFFLGYTAFITVAVSQRLCCRRSILTDEPTPKPEWASI